jgi:hypothetical protein
VCDVRSTHRAGADIRRCSGARRGESRQGRPRLPRYRSEHRRSGGLRRSDQPPVPERQLPRLVSAGRQGGRARRRPPRFRRRPRAGCLLSHARGGDDVGSAGVPLSGRGNRA